MIETKKIIDFEDPEDVRKYLESYRAILCEDLPDKVLMSFVGVLYEAKGKENIGNRIIAIDYLGFTGYGREELERIASSEEEDTGLRRLARDWLKNKEGKMSRYLCLYEINNMFGKLNDIICSLPFVEGVVVYVSNGSHINEPRTVFLTNLQRANLGFNLGSFRILNFHKPCNSLGDIYLTYKGDEVKAEGYKTDPLIDRNAGCGIRVSKSLAEHLSLKVGSRVEISRLPREKRFYV